MLVGFTTTCVSRENPAHVEVYSIQHYMIKFASDLWKVVFFPDTPVSSTNKTERHDIAEILFKVALKHLNPNLS